MAFSPSGRTLAIPSASADHVARVIDAGSGRVRTQRISGVGADGATTAPLGWVAPDVPMYLVSLQSGSPSGPTGSTTTSRRIALVDALPGTDRRLDHSPVSTMSGLVPEDLSVATDLLTGSHGVRDFPAPTWPSQSHHRARVVGLAGLGLAGLVALGWLAVRRRRRLA
jgi:hypothetical protein